MIFRQSLLCGIRNAISIYCTSNILPTNVKLIVWEHAKALKSGLEDLSA